ncbi:hypothetical protein EIP86_001605 [Pleurotus ostreatoroseus]|nr:hypothetical protein EIP86_001605 [Pleurotus ostreatoroseus]
MEKSNLEADVTSAMHVKRGWKLQKTRSPILIVVESALLLALVVLSFSSVSEFFPSKKLTSTSHLEDAISTVKWWKCRGGADDPWAECGYLVAPLDYFDSSAGSAYIALSRYPATVHPRKGMVLFNPGGPGTFLLFDYAVFKRNTVLERSYDVPSNISREEARKILVQQQREADALLKTQFEVCKKNMGEQLKNMGTSTVVRDIDFITKKLEGEDALINFFGGSYGTILGQYLVNMLPDRLGRVAIDGVADAPSWASKPYYQWYRQWMSSTSDTYEIFLRRCSEVGPSVCALAQAKGEDPEDIKTRIENFFDSLYYEPLPASDGSLPSILTIGRARSETFPLSGPMQRLMPFSVFLLDSLESPRSWIEAAKAISDAMKGNATTIINAFGFQLRDLERSAVSCNDNRPFTPPAPETVIDEALDVFQEVSRLVFSVFTTEPDGGCQYWPVTPPERFEGPWNHTLRNPILIVSNTVRMAALIHCVAVSVLTSCRFFSG